MNRGLINANLIIITSNGAMMKHFSIKLLLFIFIIIFCRVSFSSVSEHRNELKVLSREVTLTSEKRAMHLIGRISVLRQKIRFEKESIESSLKTELEIYNELFSLMERMNPFDEASSSWKLVHINPKQQKLAQLEELFVSAGQLLDTAKTKAHILGDPSKCRSKNCTAFVTGQFKLCGDGNCEAYLTGDVDKCISRDCKAYVKNDIKKCYTNDCRAYLSGDPDQCTSHDCKAYLTGNSKECMSGDCVAYLRQNPKECHSCDCKAYLSFRGVGELLRIRTHIAGYEPHSIPLGVVFSNHLEDDQEEIPSIGRSPRNCSPVFEYSGKQ